jgi:ABC-2 type transport system ATP-binding protein
VEEAGPVPILLQTQQLTKRYGKVTALDHLDLEIRAGEIRGLLGPNGSGKSTALRLLLGFLRPTSGRASIAGHDCWTHSVAARKQVAYLPGELRLYENMTGRQLVQFLGRLREQVHRSDVDTLAKQLDIDLDRPIAHLSSGMKRKVALMQVLLAHVPLLLMDEPTNTLDPTMRDELLTELRQARERGQAVLFSSHVLSEVEQICDRVAILRRGQLVHMQDMAELRQAQSIQVRFQGDAPVLPPLPGLQLRRREGDRLLFECRGSLMQVLVWLASQAVVDLRIDPLGLSEIYQRYHGNGT